MKNTTKGLVAATLGLGLLAGGATYALWSDSETVEGGTITAGNLDLALTPDTRVWQDISQDVAANPVTIDPAEFLIVPGDVISFTEGVTATLAGDNIAAELTVDAPALTGDLAADPEGVTAQYTISDGTTTTTPVDLGTAADLSDFTDLRAGSYDLTVEIIFTFDVDTPDQVRTNAQAVIGEITFELEQHRNGL